MLQGKQDLNRDQWFKKNFLEKKKKSTHVLEKRTRKNSKEAILLPYCFIQTGWHNIASPRFLLQTGLNGHHRLLYPVETQNASSSKHEEKK